MAALPSASSHRLRLQNIYFDDLIAAVRACHENFLLIQKSLAALKNQLALRRNEPDAVRLIKTEQGLINESALQLEKAMREVLKAVDEHVLSEMSESMPSCKQRVWTRTEELMRQPGSSGTALLAKLAAVVAEERESLEVISRTFELEAELARFQGATGDEVNPAELKSLISQTQREHVARFMHARKLTETRSELEQEVDHLSQRYLQSLEARHRAENQSDASRNFELHQELDSSRSDAKRGVLASPKERQEEARGRKEDWNHALEERLELAALEAESQCLEEIRQKLQEDAEEAKSTQEAAAASRLEVSERRRGVHTHQEQIRHLSRRNRDARRRCAESRSEAAAVSTSCRHAISAALSGLPPVAASLDAASAEPEDCTAPLERPMAPELASDAGVARMARLVVTERGRGLGGADYHRLLGALRSRCQRVEALRGQDEAESRQAMAHKAPLLQLNRTAAQRAEESATVLQELQEERARLPQVLGR